MFNPIADNIYRVMSVEMAIGQFVITGQKIASCHSIKTVQVFFGDFVGGIANELKAVFNT